MGYTPTNWQTGDTITAEKLNNMESGIGAADSAVGNYPGFDVVIKDVVTHTDENGGTYVHTCSLLKGSFSAFETAAAAEKPLTVLYAQYDSATSAFAFGLMDYALAQDADTGEYIVECDGTVAGEIVSVEISADNTVTYVPQNNG